MILMSSVYDLVPSSGEVFVLHETAYTSSSCPSKHAGEPVLIKNTKSPMWWITTTTFQSILNFRNEYFHLFLTYFQMDPFKS